ncbi:taste receptor type 2 member 40-like [Lissotriton helveticus]
MVSPWHVVCLAIIGAETVVGIAINTFMVVVKLLGWKNSRSINSVDIIIIMLAFLEIVFQSTICLFNVFIFQYSGLQAAVILQGAFNGLILFLGVTAFWFSTCLSVFYCLRIVEFKHPILSRLKMRLPVVIQRLLVGGAVISLVGSAPAVYFSLSQEYNYKIMSNLTANSTHDRDAPGVPCYYLIITTLIGFCFPLVLGVTSSALIIRSLCKHKRHMEQNLPSSSKARLEAHSKAAKTVLSQLFIYMFYFLMAMLIWQNVFQTASLEATICWMVLLFTVAVESILLIMGNTQLRRASESLLCTLKN